MLKEMIKRHEGLELTPYLDTAGHLTIGYGWNLDANDLPSDVATYLRLNGEITKEMADWLLDISINKATQQCHAIFYDFENFSERRQAALIDWVFNCGAGTVLTFKKTLLAIIDKDWSKAADEMMNSAWFRQVGVRGPEIVEMVRTG